MQLSEKFLSFLFSLVVFCTAALLLRAVLVNVGVLGGGQLEVLAQCVRVREVTVEEAVVAFYRELIHDGPH